jgi:hypothetical protein
MLHCKLSADEIRLAFIMSERIPSPFLGPFISFPLYSPRYPLLPAKTDDTHIHTDQKTLLAGKAKSKRNISKKCE